MNNETIQSEPVSPQVQQTETNNKQIQPASGSTIIKKLEAVKKIIKNNLKIIIVIAVIIVLGILGYFFRGLFIAATVNGSPISRLSIIQKLEKVSGKTLLDSLITEKLVQNEVDAKKITISDDEINAEIKRVEDQVSAQGGTLDEALTAQGMSRDDLRTEVILRKEMEKLLADKLNVTDQEIAQYIKDNNITVAAGEEIATNDQIRSELSSQKFSSEAESFITDLKAKAKIKYFVNY
jgi:foldase protein PrsA